MSQRPHALRHHSSTALRLSPLIPLIGHDSDPHTQPESSPNTPPEISDTEWDLRTGRAIDLLRSTLPTFFNTGLVTRAPPAVSPLWNLTGADLAKDSMPTTAKARGDDGESIYSPKIYFSYTPPHALPSPFPRTLHVEGFPLYIASSVFIRHTLNALYSDLSVDVRKLSVNPSRSLRAPHTPPSGPEQDSARNRALRREKSFFVGFSVSGSARVTGSETKWEVNSTYTFSPVTGLINKHTIDSIQPAPHEAVFDLLRAALAKLRIGAAEPGGGVGVGGAACRAHAKGGGVGDEKGCT